MRKIIIPLVLLVVIAGGAGYYFYSNQNTSELDQRFATHSSDSELEIDHSEWQVILDDYLVSDTESGVNLFDYEGLLDDGREPLDDYIEALEDTDPLTLNEQEQKAYWINLYNSLTAQLILDNYPLASITNLGSNPLEFGPWNEVSTEINGFELSLNDIEHRIIRPKFNDYRIHFAVNCASIGCPNLATEVFVADSLDEQLDQAATEYLLHPRGISFEDDQLHLSTLFEWYADDFGDSQSSILSTLGKHTSPETLSALTNYSGKPVYNYDWGLNGYCYEDDACGE